MTGTISDTTVTWRIYRMENGVKIPYLLTLERGTSIVLNERRVDVQQAARQTPDTVRAQSIASRFGIVSETRSMPDGRTVIVPLPHKSDPKALVLLNTFFDLDAPCVFPGCVELREDYKRDLAAMPANCSNCELSSLTQRYMERMRKMNAHQYVATPDPT